MMRLFYMIAFLYLFITGCETKGDRFEAFAAKETVLGSIPAHNIRNLHFTDEQHGIVIISDDTVLITQDGCKTFQVSIAKQGEKFNLLQFANDTVGFLSGRGNILYKTVDGGRSWQEFTVEIEQKLVTDIFCLSKDTFFISASDTLNTLGGYLARTVDGGSNWTVTPTIALRHIYFIDKTIGYACGEDGILKTNDGGVIWTEISKQKASEILFFSADSGYAITDRSLLLTTDGGKNWNLIKSVLNRQWVVGEDNSRLECLQSLGGDRILFTLNSRLIKVSDAGKRWFQYDFTKPYNRLEKIPPNKWIIYGYEHINMLTF